MNEPTNGECNHGYRSIMIGFFKAHIGFLSAIVTIAAFVIDKVFDSKTSAIIALLVYSVGVSALMASIYRLFSKSMSARSKDGFCRMATTCIFRTEDGKNARFECRRFIQSKSAFLTSIKHDFKWRGTGSYIIESGGSKLTPTCSADSGEFDHVIVPIGKNLYYNECDVVEVSFLSDYANIKPVFTQKIEQPIGTLEFKVMLGHKDDAGEISLYRKPIKSSVDKEYDVVSKLSFNKTFRMYEYSFTPEVGYIYKLEWQK